MSVPNSAWASFVDDSPPPPNATFLNGIQTYQAALYNGTQSIKALTIDGNSSSQAVTAPSGIKVSLAVTTWTLQAQFDDTLGAGHAQSRIYIGSGGQIALVFNATWNEGTTLWTQEDATAYSFRFILASSAKLGLRQFKGTAAGTWADGAWTDIDYIDGTTTTLTLTHTLNVTGGAVVTTGSDIKTGLHFTATGSAPTGSKGAAMNNGGGDGSVTVTGNDVRGHIVVVTGAAVNVTAGQIITTVSFANAYASAPEVVITPGNLLTSELATKPFVDVASTTTNDFTIKLSSTALATTGASYEWTYHVIG